MFSTESLTRLLKYNQKKNGRFLGFWKKLGYLQLCKFEIGSEKLKEKWWDNSESIVVNFIIIHI